MEQLFHPEGHTDRSQRQTEFSLLFSCIPNARLSVCHWKHHQHPQTPHVAVLEHVPLAGLYSVLCFLSAHMLPPSLETGPATLEIPQLEHSRNLVNGWWGGKLMVNGPSFLHML